MGRTWSLFLGLALLYFCSSCPTSEVDDVPQGKPQQQATFTVQIIPGSPEIQTSSCATPKLQDGIDGLHLKHAVIETKFETFSNEQKLKVLELERKCTKCDATDSKMAAMEAKLSKFEELKAQIVAMETKIFNIDALNARVAELETQVAKLNTEVAARKSVSGVITESLTIGRWTIRSEGSTLVFRDNESGGDKRYAFPAGGHSDMYKAGTGGEIHSSRIVFPIRWSIGEESVSYLVFRDRGVPGHDRRYAMSANLYRDL